MKILGGDPKKVYSLPKKAKIEIDFFRVLLCLLLLMYVGIAKFTLFYVYCLHIAMLLCLLLMYVGIANFTLFCFGRYSEKQGI